MSRFQVSVHLDPDDTFGSRLYADDNPSVVVEVSSRCSIHASDPDQLEEIAHEFLAAAVALRSVKAPVAA